MTQRTAPMAGAAALHVVLCHRLALAALIGANVSSAWAAGGHHAVDDAAMLDPGQCQFEAWFDRETGGARTLMHAGPACRVGAVELGLNLDRSSLDGAGMTSIGAAQLKWARTIGGGWSAGITLAVARQHHSPHYLGSTFVVPITWQASDTVLLHFNVGRNFRRGQPDTRLAGWALEWAPLSAGSLIVERFSEGGASFWRTGARWSLTPSMNLDLGRAHGLSGNAPAWWTLGLTWGFGL